MSAADGPRARRPKLTPLVAAVLVAIVAVAGLSRTHHPLRPPLRSSVAVETALRDASVRQALAGSHWTRVQANPIDAGLERVSFWAHDQIVVEVAINHDRRVTAVASDRAAHVPYGNWVAYEPAVIAALSVVFLLVTTVAPWCRLRNLDAVAGLSLVISIVLFQRRYLDLSMVAAAPGLLYLMGRCAWRGLGPTDRGTPTVTPVLTLLMARLPVARRVRWLRIAAVVLALVFAMVAVGSPNAVDVAYAVMEGATRLIHGVLPYGHMPVGIIHGDTYPILSYALYTPLALIAPVLSEWYPVDGALALAAAAALLAAYGASRLRPRESARSPELEEAALRSGLAVLSFPAFLITTSTGTTDVVLAAMLAGALVLWQRPAAGAGMLAVAGWFKLAPFALLPLFLTSLRGRQLARAVAAIIAVSSLALALVLGVGGISGLGTMVRAVSYQFTRGSLQSVWSVLGLESLQPLAQACVLGLIAAAMVRVWREPALARDRNRMAALGAAILIGLQVSADYWAFLYVAWFVPLLCAALFAAEPSREPSPELAAAGEREPLPAPVLEPLPA